MVELCASILSADFARLADEVAAAERGGATVIHVDIMDGHFVPNLTLGPPVVKSLRKVTRLPLDCHLMVDNADDLIEPLAGTLRSIGRTMEVILRSRHFYSASAYRRRVKSPTCSTS